jgi:autotransporter translocation and assembly factor TamB
VLSPVSLYDSATVDIHLKLPDDLVLRGSDLQTAYSRIGLGNMNMTIGGDLNIRKSPGGEPDVVGTVSVVRASTNFRGGVSRCCATARSASGVETDRSALEVGAQRRFRRDGHQNIRGSVRQPTVSLTSSPPMDEADVLSLIVFNQPLNQLGEGERLNLAQRAGSMAAGYPPPRWRSPSPTRWIWICSRSGRRVA